MYAKKEKTKMKNKLSNIFEQLIEIVKIVKKGRKNNAKWVKSFLTLLKYSLLLFVFAGTTPNSSATSALLNPAEFNLITLSFFQSSISFLEKPASVKIFVCSAGLVIMEKHPLHLYL